MNLIIVPKMEFPSLSYAQSNSSLPTMNNHILMLNEQLLELIYYSLLIFEILYCVRVFVLPFYLDHLYYYLLGEVRYLV